MNFIALVENIKKAFSFAERGLGKSSHLPILGSFLVSAKKNQVTVQATNLEIGITASFPAKIESEGALVLPAKPLLSFLNQVNDAKVTCAVQGKMLSIQTDSYHVQLQSQGADDFPIIPAVAETHTFEIESAFFGHALEQVVCAASTSDLRPELSSVWFSFDPSQGLVLAATDTFRLAEKTVPLQEIRTKTKNEVSCLIPLRTAQEIVRIAKEKLEPIQIAVDENQIGFQWKETRMVSRLLEGEFPAYKAVIPKIFSTEISVPAQRFLEAVKVSGVFSSRLNDVKLHVLPKTKEIAISAADASVGETQASVPAENMNGEEISAVFNYRYLIDGMLSLAAKETVDIGFGGQDKPILARAHGDASYLYILMPLRV